VIGCQRKDPLQCLHDLRSLGLGPPIGRPEVPRAQIQESVREERADIGVVGILLPDPAHRISVCDVQVLAVFRLRPHVADGERIDEVLLYR
jgi:hypothetical protein